MTCAALVCQSTSPQGLRAAPSYSYTSQAMPPSCPLSRALQAASVSTRPPRDTFTMMAPGFIIVMLRQPPAVSPGQGHWHLPRAAA